jgi:hypothetical protein
MNKFDDILDNSPAEYNVGRELSTEEYAAKKQAEREAVFAISDQIATEVSNDGGKFQQYLDVQSKFDRYSAVNALLIMAQKPEATRIGDFNYWKSQGGYVKPGQAAFSIIEPGKEYRRDDGSTAVGYNVKKVFDVSQLDARKMKTPPTQNHSERQVLAALISRTPVKISGVDELPNGGGAATDVETGNIYVRKGMGFADTFRNVSHELAYAEVMNNDKSQIDLHFTAYCASYILCRKYGIDTRQFNFSSAPAQFRDMDLQSIKRELSGVRDAAGEIASRMAKHLELVTKSAKSQEAR